MPNQHKAPLESEAPGRSQNGRDAREVLLRKRWDPERPDHAAEAKIRARQPGPKMKPSVNVKLWQALQPDRHDTPVREPRRRRTRRRARRRPAEDADELRQRVCHAGRQHRGNDPVAGGSARRHREPRGARSRRKSLSTNRRTSSQGRSAMFSSILTRPVTSRTRSGSAWYPWFNSPRGHARHFAPEWQEKRIELPCRCPEAVNGQFRSARHESRDQASGRDRRSRVHDAHPEVVLADETAGNRNPLERGVRQKRAACRIKCPAQRGVLHFLAVLLAVARPCVDHPHVVPRKRCHVPHQPPHGAQANLPSLDNNVGVLRTLVSLETPAMQDSRCQRARLRESIEQRLAVGMVLPRKPCSLCRDLKPKLTGVS